MLRISNLLGEYVLWSSVYFVTFHHVWSVEMGGVKRLREPSAAGMTGIQNNRSGRYIKFIVGSLENSHNSNDVISDVWKLLCTMLFCG